MSPPRALLCPRGRGSGAGSGRASEMPGSVIGVGLKKNVTDVDSLVAFREERGDLAHVRGKNRGRRGEVSEE